MSLQRNRDRGASPAKAWVRLVAVNVATGVALGFIVAAAIVVTDLNGLGTLLRHSDHAFVAATLLAAGFAALAAAGAVSTAVMTMPAQADGQVPPGAPGRKPPRHGWPDLPAMWRDTFGRQPSPLPVRTRRRERG